MKPTSLIGAALSAAVLSGCHCGPREYPVRSLALMADHSGPPHRQVIPPNADHTKPKPLPLSGVLIEPASSQTVSGIEDIVVHARRAENDGGGADKLDGFTALVTSPDPRRRKPYQVGLKCSEVKVAMPIGLGIFRGLRPRILTGVISGGASASTLVCWATSGEQWVAILESSPNAVLGSVELLDTTGNVIDTENFTANFTVITADVYSEDDHGNPIWRLLPPSKLADDEKKNALCRDAWIKARNAGVIPAGEKYPGPGGEP